MSKGSAIISILMAFVAGIAIGNMLGSGNSTDNDGTEIVQEAAERDAPAAGAGGDAPAGDSDITRLRVNVDGQPSKGPEDALVTIAVFSEFQCPFCSRVEPTLSRLVNENRENIRIVWMDNPLPFHNNAMPASEAAHEIFAQRGADAFWRYHDTMFQHQRELTRENLEQWAQEIGGVDMNRFRQALDNHTHQARIQASMRQATQIGARGTPNSFINGRQLVGAQPFERFNEIVQDELRRTQEMVRSGTARNRVYATLMRGARTSPAPQPAAANAPSKRPQARPQPDPAAIYNVPLGNSPSKGPADALVTIVEFSEFQCPFCSRVGPTVNQIQERYGNDVRIVFKQNPLPFHDNAMPAAEASLEVFAQGGADKFWEYHDVLFQHQRELTRENLERWAQELGGINMTRFRQALDNNTHRAAAQADQQLAQRLGARGTPSFFINGRNLRGAQPFPAFQRVIDEELARARRLVEGGTPRSQVYAAAIRGGSNEPQFIDPPAGAAPAPAQPNRPDPNRVYEIPVPRNAPAQGPANAAVTIQLFSDFQCPFCGRVRPTLEQIRERFGNRVRIVWRNFPLPFHNNAMPASEAAMEVFAQAGSEKFWEYHDVLFEHQRELTRENLETWAQELGGINMTRFRQALDNNTHRAGIQAEMQAVRTAGAQIGTPSFFINGRLLQGAQPFPAFEAAINQALEAN